MNKVPLSKVCDYSNASTSVSSLTLDTFISTDNMLPNRGGIVEAVNLPPAITCPKVELEDILLSNIRPYFKKIWYATFEGGCSTDVLVLKCKNEKYYSKFVYYSLFQDLFFKHMMNGAKGSKMPRGDKDQIMTFLITEYPKSYQKKIAEFLTTIDDKIALNNRINTELEQMAKTIYNYWFVQFDFPNEEGKPYKTSGGEMVWNEELKREIPKGWKDGKLSNFANITTGKLDSNAEKIGGKYPFFTCAPEPSTIDKYAFDDNVILVAGNNASGNFHVSKYKGQFNAYQRTYVITSKVDVNQEFLYQVIKREMSLLKTKGNGSQTKFITLNMLTDIKIPVVSEAIMKKFHELNSSMYEKQMILSRETQELIQLRDFLLPLLMNGQVTIQETEEENLLMAAEPSINYSK